jgi:hypothetical protein
LGVDADLPGRVVDDAVVVAAEQDEVDGGVAVVGPVSDVVGVAHDRWPGDPNTHRNGLVVSTSSTDEERGSTDEPSSTDG